MPIERLQIQGVRGIRRELILELGGSSLVLRGDNGTGKSSIVAGLLWALRGEQEPSSARPGTEQSYRANVLDGPSKSRVVVKLSNGASLRVSPGSVEGDKGGLALREGCKRSSPFLLRKQLLRFLDDRPVDRFRYLEAFLDLEQADATREALQARARYHESAAELHRETLDAKLRTVTAAGVPREFLPSALSWSSVVAGLVAWSDQLGLPPAAPNWSDLLAVANRMGPLLQGDNLARTRVVLEAALASLQKVHDSPSDPAPLLQKIERLLIDATDASIVPLLEEAARHFAMHKDATTCPVCRQAIGSDVSEKITQRLHGLRELRQCRESASMNGVSWRSYLKSVLAAVDAYIGARGLKSLAEDPEAPLAPPGIEMLSQDVDGPTGQIESQASALRRLHSGPRSSVSMRTTGSIRR